MEISYLCNRQLNRCGASLLHPCSKNSKQPSGCASPFICLVQAHASTPLRTVRMYKSMDFVS